MSLLAKALAPDREIRNRIALVALLLIAAGVSASCRSADATPSVGSSRAEAAPEPARIRVARVDERKVTRSLEVSGTLAADETSQVAAQTAGAVVEVLVDVGSRVKKGDVLVVLDDRDATLRLARDKAAARQQQVRLGLSKGRPFDVEQVPEVRAASEERNLAKAELTRAETLLRGGALAQAAYDAARLNAERAQAAYETQRNLAEQSRVGLEVASAQSLLSAKALADSRVTAPFDGVVTERRVAPGEHAAVGRVVVVLMRDQPLRFRFEVAEADVGAIAVGLPVALTVTAHGERRFDGAIVRMSGSLNAQSRTLPVEAEIDNGNHELRPGFFARGSVTLAGAEESALFVPTAAVGDSGSSRRVFVRDGNRVSERLVTVQQSVDGMLLVRGPLTRDDEVAIVGVETLTDGALVAVEE